MAQYWQNVFLRVYFLSMALYIVLREIAHKAHKSALERKKTHKLNIKQTITDSA